MICPSTGLTSPTVLLLPRPWTSQMPRQGAPRWRCRPTALPSSAATRARSLPARGARAATCWPLAQATRQRASGPWNRCAHLCCAVAGVPARPGRAYPSSFLLCPSSFLRPVPRTVSASCPSSFFPWPAPRSRPFRDPRTRHTPHIPDPPLPVCFLADGERGCLFRNGSQITCVSKSTTLESTKSSE